MEDDIVLDKQVDDLCLEKFFFEFMYKCNIGKKL